jgi:predicted Zn-dependent protease with MMP-like domain
VHAVKTLFQISREDLFTCCVTVRAAMVTVTRERFEELVADALDTIPPELASEMTNVAVLVEDWPTDSQRPRRGTLLGLYEGVPLTKRGPIGYSGVMPDRITIFQGPLSARARDEVELAAQVRKTVLHEVGHYFGITDARLHELGWA